MENDNTRNYSKRPLWQWALIYLVIALVLYGAIYYLFLSNRTNTNNGSAGPSYTAPNNSSNGNNNSGSSAGAVSKEKFQGSSVYSFAYKIYPGPLTTSAKMAMNGFTMQTKVLSDGSTQVNLTAQTPEYKSQQYVVKPGYSLYFIEKNSGDDSISQNREGTLTDDTAILVDPQGYIVR